MSTEGRRSKTAFFSGDFRTWTARSVALTTGFYWALLLYATHYPKPEALLGRNPPSDKLLHLIAYGLLGFLAAATLWGYGGWNLRNAARLAAALAVTAVLDEVTQPIFSRAADPIDWACDCLGIAAGILVVAGLNSLASARGNR
jgi:VanZ family protein